MPELPPLSHMNSVIEAGARRTMGLGDDWVYRDFPKMLPEYWNAIIETLGPDNHRVIAQSTYGDGLRRGQLMISPKGFENIRNADWSHLK